LPPLSHELRNECVEELNCQLGEKNGAILGNLPLRESRNRGMEGDEGKRGEK
jgi:hypothetical protein